MSVNKNLNIIIAGGGTGGHLFPGVAIADKFLEKNPDNNILFINTGNKIEKKILDKENYTYKIIPSGGILGKSFAQKIKNLKKIATSILLARKELIKFKPNAVVGVGGYVSVPVIIASLINRTPVFIQEQNSIPGITNKIFSYFTKLNFVSFKDTKLGLRRKKIFSGNPIRNSISKGSYSIKDKNKITILITGGSQGAKAINNAFCQSLEYLEDKNKIHVIHQTGVADFDEIKSFYEQNGLNHDVRPFFDNMPEVYAKTDLIIARAGASTLAEIKSANIPAIFIPFPHATHNHQYYNALSLKKYGAAFVIEEKNISGKILGNLINDFISNPDKLQVISNNMKKISKENAAEIIYEKITGKLI